MSDINKKDLEDVTGGVDDIDSKTRKSSGSYPNCFKGKIVINLADPACAKHGFKCSVYSECKNPGKVKV